MNVLTYLEEELFALCRATFTEETVAEALSMQARCSVEPGRCGGRCRRELRRGEAAGREPDVIKLMEVLPLT